MNSTIEQADIETILGELDEAGTHQHRAFGAVEAGEWHKALTELTSLISRAEWAADLIKKESER